MQRRVVITGLGLVTPIGIGKEETWKSLVAGKPGISRITKFDASSMATQIAGEVKNFKPEDFLSRKEIRRMDDFVMYALAAARLATEDASLTINGRNANRVGVITGCGLGGLRTIEKYHKILLEEGPKKISPFFIPMLIANMAPGQISIAFGAKGPNVSIETACAAGSHAVGDAFKMIQRGAADVMITGGVEATVTPLAISGFNAMRAISTRNDDPERASRPFDRDRDGFVLAEGAGIIIMEALEHALERGANIYAELIGYGLSGDAFHMAAPAPEGEGMARCMQMALDDAGIEPQEIDYINAHGTSTDLNDKYETQAIKTVFGEHSYRLAVSSTKSMTGHLLGGAGGVEAAFTVLALREGIIPPTINYENPDPDCDLDYVPNTSRKADIRTALSNSFGFGGTNAALVFRRYDS
ncbi:MAG: beta-ketoacyl-ACP synthase II [Deltaproteobacteria bacterium]|nr:beta-ketoacyl-ACP synthase II [Deltaproteobacteria bacterium]MBW2071820.1 beta-ketoacyl-ACP synthase II [Deltaproteobacteria bacterium]